MSECYLCLKEKGKVKKLLFFSEKQVKEAIKFEKGVSCRISPIYCIFPAKRKIPPLKKSCKVSFLFPQNSFQAIGKIVNDIDVEKQKNIWFSLGLSSIIVFSEDIDIIKEIKKLLDYEIRASETWSVEKNVIDTKNIKYELKNPEPFDSTKFKIDYSSIDEIEALKLLNEFSLNINRITNLAAQYAPALLFTVKSIIDVAQELVNELEYLYNYKKGKKQKTIPPSLPKKSLISIEKDHIEIQERIFQRVGALVEIVATLSHVNSQAFGCVVPIIDNTYRIRAHSFLGIGSGYLGVVGFTQYVEKSFFDFPVTKVIKNIFIEKSKLDYENLLEYNLSLWDDLNFKLDDQFDDFEKDPIISSLIYYSLRLGFKESSYTISSAWQVLSFTDSAPWSLMTITHELLHSHVRSILGCIFSGPEDKTTESWFNELCRDYIQKYHSDTDNNGKNKNSDNLLDSIRILIIEYCIYKDDYANLLIENSQTSPDQNSKNDVKTYYDSFTPNPESILEKLRGYFKEINEIFVHVLDYHYFYDCNPALYIGLLWESWATVPSVLQDVEVYLTRTMLAIGTEVTSDGSKRFKDTVQLMEDNLDPICKKNPSNLTIKKALRYLKDPEVLNVLQNLFDISILLADMVNHLLCSKNIYSSLVVDSDKGIDNFYDLTTGSFEDTPIQSPVAFVLDRLRFSLKNEESDLCVEYRSAWLLHVCASTLDHKNTAVL